MTEELELKELKRGDKVFFKAIDDAPGGRNLGRAEFLFCPVWENGRLKKFYIYHAQQYDVKYYYVVKCDSDDFQVDSWTHKGIDAPNIWLHFWCKEHECVGMRVSVPRNSNVFNIQTLSTSGVHFDYEKEKSS